jgi:hypothetical protein
VYVCHHIRTTQDESLSFRLVLKYKLPVHSYEVNIIDFELNRKCMFKAVLKFHLFKGGCIDKPNCRRVHDSNIMCKRPYIRKNCPKLCGLCNPTTTFSPSTTRLPTKITTAKKITTTQIETRRTTGKLFKIFQMW